MIKYSFKKLVPFLKTQRYSFASPHNFNQIEIIHSSIQNIHFNLATEEYLFDFCPLNHPILFLWRNDKTVVIGTLPNLLINFILLIRETSKSFQRMQFTSNGRRWCHTFKKKKWRWCSLSQFGYDFFYKFSFIFYS